MSSGDAAVIAAVVSASVAVVVAVVTQIWTSLRARTDRRYVARRAAIVDAQDAAVALRDALDTYGQRVRALAHGASAALPTPGAGAVANAGSAAAAPLTSAGSAANDIPTRDPLTLDESAERARERVRGQFAVCRSRVEDDMIRAALGSWETAASRRFISVEEVTAAVEDEWFAYVQELAGIAFRSSSGRTSTRARAAVPAPAPLPE